MINRADIEEYIVKNGVPVTRPIYADGQRLRVMDATVLPAALREHFDERGFYHAPDGPTEPQIEEPETKKGKKRND